MNVALVACAGTVTVAGTVTAASLLDRLTDMPPVGAAEVRLTLQLSLALPVIDPLAQLRPVTGTSVPSARFPTRRPHPVRRKAIPSSAAIWVNDF